MSSDKYRYIGKDGKVKHLKDVNTPSYLGGKPFGNDIGPCGIPKGSRTWKLRAQLMKQLKTLDGESDCLGQCKEDESLDKMEKRFAKFFQKQDEKCVLSSFEKDDRLRLLAAKKEMLEHQSFAFLHSECEGDEECNPFEADIMSKTLIECCGVKDGELLFGDESMAAVGKFLSGSQKVGESPAALGHASNLYPTGLIAPGVDKSKLWINICYLVARSELDMSAAEIAQRKEGKELQAEHAYLDTKWVPANVLEQKKYTTLKGIDRAITERKRAILKVNRQILELQLQMANVHGSDHFFSGEDSDTSDFADSQRGLELYVTNSVTRAKNMLLGSEARRKMKEADEAFHLRVAHGKKGVSKATEKALAKLMGGKKPRRKKHGRRHSRRRR